MKNQKKAGPKPFLIIFIIAVFVTGVLTLINLIYTTSTSDDNDNATSSGTDPSFDDTPIELQSILHYATSSVLPQQSREEIRVTLSVLKSLSPCNFLIFGLGHDSLMWSSFNPRGTTLFLEEDRRRVQRFLSHAPGLRAYDVRYDTRLSHADSLLASYRLNPHCLPPDVTLLSSWWGRNPRFCESNQSNEANGKYYPPEYIIFKISVHLRTLFL